ncbi:cytochrome P450 [Phanerochaete sordida]|uniref:Cytochrome P450 n=1 Tax=Phanerochaete sordida TaxID=48140 RepID=A0A9P3GTQ3_9APHY|nr:cytochrome P450 [Phanerochaete sordida]
MSFNYPLEGLYSEGATRLVMYFAFGVALALLLQSVYSAWILRHIPTEGSSTIPLLSYKGAYDFLDDITGVFNRGYAKYKGRLFKVAFTDRWIVVVTGKDLLDDLHRLPKDTTSFMHAAGDLTGSPYIFGHGMIDDPWHVPIIRDRLTKHLPSAFPAIYDEISTSLRELMPSCAKEWTPVPALKLSRTIVARTSNRVFVGLPVCRNEGFLNLLVDFASDVGRTRNILAWVSPAFKGVVAKMVTKVRPRIEAGMRYLGPTIKERRDLARQLGDSWSDKPDDMLQWMVDAVSARHGPDEDVVRGVFATNFAAINTSSSSFTHALYHLAANPRYIDPLREEVDAVIAEEGWTKTALGKMWRLDSFMRESLRHNSINPFTVRRKALKTFAFSDGTVIPRGTVLVTPPYATHFDEGNFDNAAAFDPWRFVHEEERDNSPAKHQFVTASTEYVGWGHGKHACPGRFFAATELKIMMAYVVVHYDVKFEREGVRPANVHKALTISPDPKAQVLFRERSPMRLEPIV